MLPVSGASPLCGLSVASESLSWNFPSLPGPSFRTLGSIRPSLHDAYPLDLCSRVGRQDNLACLAYSHVQVVPIVIYVASLGSAASPPREMSKSPQGSTAEH